MKDIQIRTDGIKPSPPADHKILYFRDPEDFTRNLLRWRNMLKVAGYKINFIRSIDFSISIKAWKEQNPKIILFKIVFLKIKKLGINITMEVKDDNFKT